jgi:site-specific DNA-methyltransferase (adenine-specific)
MPQTKTVGKTTRIRLNTIYNEHCLKTMSKMQDSFIDMVLTSPPYDNMRTYGGDNFNDFEAIATELYRIMKDCSIIVWITGDQTKNGDESGTSFKQALFFKQLGFKLFDTMIYLKPPRGAVGNNKTYWQTFEYMFILSKGIPKTINLLYDRENKETRNGDTGTKRLTNGELKKLKRPGYTKLGRRTNVWQYNVGSGHSATDKIAYEHPAIFPEKLAKDHILSWSNIDDVIYDPFLGSGTTAKMAQLCNRNYIGSEINKDYYKIAKKRTHKVI